MTTVWRHERHVARDGWHEHRIFNARRGGDLLTIYRCPPGFEAQWQRPMGIPGPDVWIHVERQRRWRKVR